MKLASVPVGGGQAFEMSVNGMQDGAACLFVAVRDGDSVHAAVVTVAADVLLEWTPEVAGRMLLAEVRAAVARAEPIAVR